MTAEVIEEAEDERNEASCIVETVDATGGTRRYQVSLTDEVIGGRSLLEGRRIDDHDYDRNTPDSPPQSVYDTARSWFSENGYPVHEEERLVQ